MALGMVILSWLMIDRFVQTSVILSILKTAPVPVARGDKPKAAHG